MRRGRCSSRRSILSTRSSRARCSFDPVLGWMWKEEERHRAGEVDFLDRGRPSAEEEEEDRRCRRVRARARSSRKRRGRLRAVLFEPTLSRIISFRLRRRCRISTSRVEPFDRVLRRARPSVELRVRRSWIREERLEGRGEGRISSLLSTSSIRLLSQLDTTSRRRLPSPTPSRRSILLRLPRHQLRTLHPLPPPQQ